MAKSLLTINNLTIMFKTFIDFEKPTSLMTNFGDKELKLYELAVETYNTKHNKILLYISNIAKYGDNKTLGNHSSLHSTVGQDMSDFWDMFNKLREVLNQFNNQQV